MDKSENINPNEAREQFAREKGIERAADRRTAQSKRGDMSKTKSGQIITENAVDVLAEYIQGHFDAQAAKVSPTHWKEWYHHLRFLEPKVVATYALRGMVDSVGANWTFNNTIVQLANSINSVLLHVTLKQSRDGIQLLEDIANRVKRKPGSQYTLRERAMYIAAQRKKADASGFAVKDENGNDLYVWSEEMDNNTKGQVGGFMAAGVMEVTNLFEFEYVKKKHTDPYQGEKYLKFTDEAVSVLSSLDAFLDAQTPLFGPMLDVPYAWDADSLGPYHDVSLAQQVPLVKRMGPDQKEALLAALKNNTMPEAVEAINDLQETPLAINDHVVEAVKWARQRVVDSEGTLQINSFPNLMQVPELANIPKDEFAKWEKDDRQNFKREQLAARKTNREVVANHLNIKRALAEAETIIKARAEQFDRFYLPHQFDFRGRIYHTSEFGHHNADFMRGMLCFANKTEITQDNVQFLALQIANCFGNGIDKMRLRRRKAWVKLNMKKIMAVGADFKDETTTWDKCDPETNKVMFDKETGEVIQETPFDFWRFADDPFQFVAACREMYLWVNAKGPYYSGLPVALDATQSGIQVYAALGRNQEDGEKVNLTNNKAPGDLYTAVKGRVVELIEEDIAELEAKTDLSEDEEEDLLFARQWMDFGVKRKHMKRPTMTWAYSSRVFGIADQIRSDTMEPMAKEVRRGLRAEHPFGPDNGYHAAWYMAKKAVQAIEDTVKSAHDGMKYFQRVVSICNGCHMHLHYTTPLGFPMMQYYRDRKKSADRIDAPLWDTNNKKIKTGKVTLRNYNDTVDYGKSERACSPNLIHSLDATLLMMTVRRCKKAGVSDMMVVHDSFSTTIDNVPTLAREVRLAFVELFQENEPYTQLKEQTLERIAKRLDEVDQGDLDITEVLQSDYAFS